MSILILFLVIGISSFAVPMRYLKTYFLFSCFIISGFLIFYSPPESDDLFRYYKLFDIIKELSFKELWQEQFEISDWLYNYLLHDYLQNARVFISIMFLLSRIGVKQIIVVFFSLLTYIPIVLFICEAGKDTKASKVSLCICFIAMLACVDIRFVTCLRNLSAYALFVYIMYLDIMKKKKTAVCYIWYILLCLLHMSCIVLLFARSLVLIFGKRFQIIICIGMLSAFLFSETIAGLLRQYFSWIPYMSRLADRIIDYNIKRTNYNTHGALFFIGSLLACFGVFLFQQKKAKGNISHLYSVVFLYIFAFTIGSFHQYDVLMRNCELIALLIIPYMLSAANSLKTNNMEINICSNSEISLAKNVAAIILLAGILLFSFVFYGLFSYLPMQKGMVIF